MVQHLFISCPFVCIIWRMIHFTYNIPTPSNITDMFGNWLNGVPKEIKARIRIGVSALYYYRIAYSRKVTSDRQKEVRH
jgi:hypothetical protein